MSGELDRHVVDHLRRRLERDGQMTGASDDQDVPAALYRLNERLRTALGEYDQPGILGAPGPAGSPAR